MTEKIIKTEKLISYTLAQSTIFKSEKSITNSNYDHFLHRYRLIIMYGGTINMGKLTLQNTLSPSRYGGGKKLKLHNKF
jgi:hypothetical protein